MRRSLWSNVKGYVIIDIDDEPPTLLERYAKIGDQLEITFLSSGESWPASMYGGADHMGWPAEHSEDRHVIQALLYRDEETIMLPECLHNPLYEQYMDQIDKEELNEQD